jgi:hypothetical protein
MGWLPPLALLICAACGEIPVTEVFACYSVDPALATRNGSLRICAQTDDMARVLYGCDGSDIGSLTSGEISQGFVRSRAAGVLLRFEAQIEATGGGTTTITQRAAVPFQDDRVVDVSLRIDAACEGTGCAAGLTCVAGTCFPDAVPAECLADHLGPSRPGCDDPRVTRGCGGL